MIGTVEGLAVAAGIAFGSIAGLILLIALAPFLFHLAGILMMLLLGAPPWIIAALLLGFH
jgi:hypothetical protein